MYCQNETVTPNNYVTFYFLLNFVRKTFKKINEMNIANNALFYDNTALNFVEKQYLVF